MEKTALPVFSILFSSIPVQAPPGSLEGIPSLEDSGASYLAAFSFASLETAISSRA
jgi:hypothetical protein